MNITLSSERVAAVFCALSGEQNAADFGPLCLSATKSICAMLRRGKNIKSRETELIHAAACLAFYRYILAKQSEGVSAYKAGDITINSSLSDALSAAKALLDDALLSLSDCLLSRGFCFKTV